MERILPSSTNGIKFLNSKVVGTSVSKGRHNIVSAPIKLTLRHIRDEGVSNPSCMWWDYVSRTWSGNNCEVISTNESHTTCHCMQFGNFAILMEQGIGIKATVITPNTYESRKQNIATIVGVIVSIIAGMLLAVMCFLLTED